MSTIITTIPGAAFEHHFGKISPADVNAHQACAYQGVGGVAAFDVIGDSPVAYGAPTYGDNYAVLAATDGFDTGIVLDTAHTYMVVLRNNQPSGELMVPISTVIGGGTGYVGLVIASNILRVGYLSASSTTTLVQVVGALKNNQFGFYAVRVEEDGGVDFWAGNAGVLTKTHIADPAQRWASPGTLTVNYGRSTSFPTWCKPMDIAYSGVYKSALTDGEVEDQYDALRAFFDNTLPNTL